MKLMRRPRLQPESFKVGEQLRLVNREKALLGLELDEHHGGRRCALDDEINTIRVLDGQSLVPDGLVLLSKDASPSFLQFIGQARLVDGLQEPRSELAVNRLRGADDGFTECVQVLCASSASSAPLRFQSSPSPNFYRNDPTSALAEM